MQTEANLVSISADIVSAYVSNNNIQSAEIASLLSGVHAALANIGKPSAEPIKREPPVPINKTIKGDHIISLEDGKPYKSLKRHLTGRGLTPDQYRQKWGLRPDYPMVAPEYSKPVRACSGAWPWPQGSEGACRSDAPEGTKRQECAEVGTESRSEGQCEAVKAQELNCRIAAPPQKAAIATNVYSPGPDRGLPQAFQSPSGRAKRNYSTATFS
jgi:predicted transcriptional regulator